MILVTGGMGYIGSHVVVKLLELNFYVIILDNLNNSSSNVLSSIELITGKKPIFIHADICNAKELDFVFSQYNIDAVFHFAGHKAVSESVADPLKYYLNNVNGSLTLINSMKKANVKKIIFSSSATIYSESAPLPFDEASELKPTSPYGQSKLIIENILTDLYKSDPRWKIGVLRYFNPIGAHKSGLIGDSPKTKAFNLMPALIDVFNNKQNELFVYGSNYATKDGSAVRDYIHIDDLANGHIACLSYLIGNHFIKVNLGTGKQNTVLDLIKEFESAANTKISTVIKEPRNGDMPISYAKVDLAYQELKWQAKLSVKQMCIDVLNFIKTNNS
jgi:UDP-glucose 4-epimerase